MNSNFVWEDLPAKVVLYNPPKKVKGGGSPITNYPISEEVVDENGNPVIDQLTAQARKTGEVYEWSLDVDDRKEFPKYVAKILKDRYGFLVVELKAKGAAEPAKQEISQFPVCPICQTPFGTEEILQRHLDEAHPDVE